MLEGPLNPELLAMASNIETEAIRMAEQKFPVKLHAMLTSLEAEGGAQVASWMPHGCSFKVHNQEKFMAEVLPKWFKLTKHTSFIRQLNIYNFKRITSGVDAGSYHHPHFVRGWPGLAEKIERVKVKGKSDPIISTPDPSTQGPNFYHYNPLPQNQSGIPWSQSIEASEQQARLTKESAVQQSLRKQQMQYIVNQQRHAQEVAHPSSSLLSQLELQNIASRRGTENVLSLSALELGNAASLSACTNSLIIPPILHSPLSGVESAVRYFTLQAGLNNLGPGNRHSRPGPMSVRSSQFPHVGNRLNAVYASLPVTAALSPYEDLGASSQFVQALRGEQIRRALSASQTPLDTTSDITSFIARYRPYDDYRAPARAVQPSFQLPGERGSRHNNRQSAGRRNEGDPRYGPLDE